MTTLVAHGRARLNGLLATAPATALTLPEDFEGARFERAERARGEMEDLCHQARPTLAQEFLAAVAGLVDEPSQAKGVVEEVMALDLDHLAELSVQPRPCSSQRAIAATTWRCSAASSRRPAGMPCHLARQLRQHVAVACWAIKTGWPRIGVCLPSLTGSAGASRFSTIRSMIEHNRQTPRCQVRVLLFS